MGLPIGEPYRQLTALRSRRNLQKYSPAPSTMVSSPNADSRGRNEAV